MTAPTIRELEAALFVARRQRHDAEVAASEAHARAAALVEEAAAIRSAADDSAMEHRRSERAALRALWTEIRRALDARRLNMVDEHGALMTVGPLCAWLACTGYGYRATCEYRGDAVREEHEDPVESVRLLLRRIHADTRLGARTRAIVAARLERIGGDP